VQLPTATDQGAQVRGDWQLREGTRPYHRSRHERKAVGRGPRRLAGEGLKKPCRLGHGACGGDERWRRDATARPSTAPATHVRPSRQRPTQAARWLIEAFYSADGLLATAIPRTCTTRSSGSSAPPGEPKDCRRSTRGDCGQSTAKAGWGSRSGRREVCSRPIPAPPDRVRPGGRTRRLRELAGRADRSARRDSGYHQGSERGLGTIGSRSWAQPRVCRR
jgi:hypothetical protein